MRINTPITDIEYVMQEGESIVSMTDTKGLITYVNQDFVRVSGFDVSELIGAPHNLVRHPDMPAEAFADMWASLKAGLSWTGLVKNRRKNGDFYWVKANAIPVLEAGVPVGYMSVRTKPTTAEIRDAADVYAKFSSGQKHGLMIYHGKILQTDTFSRLARVFDMTLKTKMTAFALAIVVAMLVSVVSTLLGLGSGYVIVSAVFAAVFAIIFAASIIKTVIDPLDEATKIANAIAGGDLSNKVTATKDDEVGRLLSALNQMNVNLVSIVSDVRSNVDRINLGVSEIAKGNGDLSARTESQASALEETASSMEQLASTVKQNADNARQANQLVISASEVASKGGSVIKEVMVKMDSISESAKKIADIIGVIDGIAFQTNILALNAAVEAARAGEQGRGFAVVASEVRNLAHRSAAAAKEIKGLITDSVERVESGVSLVDQAGKTMTEIVSSVNGVTDIMGEISAASAEQSSGIDQVNRAVSEMDEVTQRNAALVEEAAAAAEALMEDTEHLEQAVSVFKISGAVSSTAQASPKPRVEPKAKAAPAAPPTAPANPSPELKTVKAPVKPALKHTAAAKPAASASKQLPATPASTSQKIVNTDISGDDWEEF